MNHSAIHYIFSLMIINLARMNESRYRQCNFHLQKQSSF